MSVRRTRAPRASVQRAVTPPHTVYLGWVCFRFVAFSDDDDDVGDDTERKKEKER